MHNTKENAMLQCMANSVSPYPHTYVWKHFLPCFPAYTSET